MRGLRPALLALLAGLVPAAMPARAEEPLLEDPAGMVGVEPVRPGGYTATLGGAWERARSGRRRDTFGAALEAEAGLVRGFDLRVQHFGLYGRAAPRDAEETAPSLGGETRIGLRWQILEEGAWVPALGVFGAVTTAYGRSRPATDLEVTTLFGRTLRGGDRPVALLLNAGWAERLNPEPGERAGRYQLAAGIAHALAQDISVGLSVERNQGDRGERDETLVQAGLWHRLAGGGPILSLRGGFGIGRDSPNLLLGVTLKWEIGD